MPTGVGRYEACRDCGEFEVTTDDLYCPNCGIVVPSRRLSNPEAQAMVRSQLPDAWREEMGSRTVGAWRVFAVALLASLFTPYVGLFLTICLAGGSILYLLVRRRAARTAWPALRSIRFGSSLRATEAVLAERITDLDARDRAVDISRAQLNREDDSTDRRRLQELLAQAKRAIADQRVSCRAQQLDVRIVRWLNQLEPLAYDLEYCSSTTLGKRVR